MLYKDEDTGATEVVIDPTNSSVVYASLWPARQAPWEISSSFEHDSDGIFNSTDGGNTWHQLTKGMPLHYSTIGFTHAHRILGSSMLRSMVMRVVLFAHRMLAKIGKVSIQSRRSGVGEGTLLR